MANNAGSPLPPNYNLDDQSDFQTCFRQLQASASSNFAVRFDASQAQCSVDLQDTQVKEWLGNHAVADNETLWLSFWADDVQKPIVDAIAAKYDLSPRLSGLLCPLRSKARDRGESAHGTTDTEEIALQSQSPSRSSQSDDVERLISEKPRTVDIAATMQQISFGDVVDDLWHFCSVDWGQHYLYIGFNALFSVRGKDASASPDKPSGQRIWTSLLLCDDGTVISVFERPPQDPSTYEAAVETARRNVLNVFRHLSLLHMHDKSSDALMKVRIRPEGPLTPINGSSATEAASLLFYYLFDDWITTYALIAKKEQPYRVTLEGLRRSMSQTADVGLVETLHLVGRQLNVLKRMYQSYEQIVSRILQRQRARKEASRQRPRISSLQHEEMRHGDSRSSSPQSHFNGHHYYTEDDNQTVSLSMSALFRFERLLDRIRLYALTEIEECLNEKESLTFMNFNLVALKESQAVEKLTRTTVLLAKATMLFLPVSLMTGYFSIQIGEIQSIYSLKTYWLCFLVVASVSIAFLFGFGITTSTVEGKTVYKSMSRMLWDKRKPKPMSAGGSEPSTHSRHIHR